MYIYIPCRNAVPMLLCKPQYRPSATRIARTGLHVWSTSMWRTPAPMDKKYTNTPAQPGCSHATDTHRYRTYEPVFVTYT